MQTKLTLRLDADLIDQAKAWAKHRRISLSQAVGDFFAQLSPHPPAAGETSPWVRRLSGVARRRGRALSDEETHRARLDQLAAKHR